MALDSKRNILNFKFDGYVNNLSSVALRKSNAEPRRLKYGVYWLHPLDLCKAL